METYSPIICCMAVSLLIQQCSKSLIEDCGGSSYTPVDRAGGVKIEAFTSLILCRSYVNIFSCSCKIYINSSVLTMIYRSKGTNNIA